MTAQSSAPGPCTDRTDISTFQWKQRAIDDDEQSFDQNAQIASVIA